MTKSELINRLKKLIDNEFQCSSDKLDDVYYDLRYDIAGDFEDIREDR